MSRSVPASRRLAVALPLAAVALLAWDRSVRAQDCSSFNPADWPAPARPYFHLVVDTSGSMTACTTPPTNYPTECNQNAAGYALNSCGMVPNRLNDAKCALRKTVQAFSGSVNFGLETYASYLSGCAAGACASDCGTPTGGTCNSDVYGCTWNIFPSASPAGSACGNFPACGSGAGYGAPSFPEGTWRNGGNVVVPLLQDPWWTYPGSPPPASNVAGLLQWFDGQCTGNTELFAAGATPIAGSLRSAAEYLRAGWRLWSNADYCPTNFTFTTPMNASDRACRSVNVILVTDGDETCDNQASAVAAAQDLYSSGVTLGGITWPVRVYVINFAGGSTANTNQIAAAGGTGSSLLATNEVTLAQGLSDIIASAIQPEVCNNGDDNCNGCVDEGYKHYADVSQPCYDCVVHAGYATEAACRAGQVA
ncbi:MAG: hypothetical protein HY908_31060, partial [Myxococcales bacterium]|nr:hypothetical protein [Myxococcales bacterium]